MKFSKEGAVRVSFVVVAGNAILIPLYTLLLPSRTRCLFRLSWELDRVRPGGQRLFLLLGASSFVQWSAYIKSVSKLIDVVKFLNVDNKISFDTV